ncbi:MAG: O-acetylhomoserine aminocarboxypropyltransferase/cysteine synthase family protein [Chitinispirillaceae bacterium]
MGKQHRLETQVLHAGARVDETGARAVPVHRTSSYLFKSAEHAANLFGLKELGNIYTRLQNPTQDVLEQRMATLENGAAALAVASGTSGVFYSIVNICKQGDEVVSARNLYGGSFTMLNDILPGFGIKTTFVDPAAPHNFEEAITDRTRALYTEVIGNPVLDVAHIEAISAVARRHHLPLIVDSTFTTPYLFRPLDHGADIVVHSLTKWLGGHGTGIGGIVVDSGKFDWTDRKFSLYNDPESSYHDLRFGHDLGELASLAYILRMRLVPLRNLGACISPDNAWMFLQGIETLPLRMQKHCDNALAVARYLADHPKVSWIRYPGLEDDPSHQTASKQLENGFGGVVVFGLKGGHDSGVKFIEALRLFSHLANVGDARSLAIHPQSTTHSQLTRQQAKEAGLTPDLVRLSVGIEHVDDLLEDLEQALKSA